MNTQTIDQEPIDQEYMGLYNPIMYPSSYVANRIENAGRYFPGVFSKKYIRKIIMILSELGFKAEMKLRPAGSIPYIVIEYVENEEKKYWWANDLEKIESFLNRFNVTALMKFNVMCWERF